jgi:hypothetical protein
VPPETVLMIDDVSEDEDESSSELHVEAVFTINIQAIIG